MSSAAIRAAAPSGNTLQPADSSTVDPLLERFTAAWEHLSESDRLALVELAERLAGVVRDVSVADG